MNAESALVALIVLAALLYTALRAWRTVKRRQGGCNCGDGRGCARMQEALKAAGARRR